MKKTIFTFLLYFWAVSISHAAIINISLPSLIGNYITTDGATEVNLFDGYSFSSIQSLSISFNGAVLTQPDWVWLGITTPDSSEIVLSAITLPETGNYNITSYPLNPGGIVDNNFYNSLALFGGTLRFTPYDGAALCPCPAPGEFTVSAITLTVDGTLNPVPIPAAMYLFISALIPIFGLGYRKTKKLANN